MAKETKLYDILGILPTATEQEVKKAYRIMALKWHPDKNNHSKESTEMFQQITEAYQTLSDSTQRVIYDKYGANGANKRPTVDPTRPSTTFNRTYEPSPPFSDYDPDFLFTKFFGTRSFFNSQSSNPPSPSTASAAFRSAPTKGPDINHKLSCSLEDLYNGKSTRLGLSRTILCSECDAKGGKNPSTCPQCNGLGKVVVRKQIGPLIQRFETVCPSCHGSGEYISVNDRCPACQGAKTMEQRKVFKVDVQPGAKDGDLIVLDGEGDRGVNIIPGDVVITLVQREHAHFTRKNNDLLYNAQINLLTSLCGGEIIIKHLNGQYLNVTMRRGEIIRPGQSKIIKGLGMPINNKNQFGDLIIKFDIEFPKYDEIDASLLENALPSSPLLSNPPGTELKNVELEEYYPRPDEPSNDSSSQKRRRSFTEPFGAFKRPQAEDTNQCQSQ